MKLNLLIPIVIFLLVGGIVEALSLIKAEITISNEDDDSTWVAVYIDDTYRGGKYIPPKYEAYMGIYYFNAGNHTFELRWKDPDLCDISKKSEKIEISGPGYHLLPYVKKIHLIIDSNSRKCVKDEKKETHLEVFIKNIDDDNLWVDVMVERQVKVKYVEKGERKYYGHFTGLTPGEIPVTIKWLDPDLEGFQEKSYKVRVKEGETQTVEFQTERNR